MRPQKTRTSTANDNVRGPVLSEPQLNLNALHSTLACGSLPNLHKAMNANQARHIADTPKITAAP